MKAPSTKVKGQKTGKVSKKKSSQKENDFVSQSDATDAISEKSK